MPNKTCRQRKHRGGAGSENLLFPVRGIKTVNTKMSTTTLGLGLGLVGVVAIGAAVAIGANMKS